MTLRAIIIRSVECVAREQNCSIAKLADDLKLQDSGLNSLCWAIIVARLEKELGFDPFTASEDVYFPVSFGDFIRAYENGNKQAQAALG